MKTTFERNLRFSKMIKKLSNPFYDLRYNPSNTDLHGSFNEKVAW